MLLTAFVVIGILPFAAYADDHDQRWKDHRAQMWRDHDQQWQDYDRQWREHGQIGTGVTNTSICVVIGMSGI